MDLILTLIIKVEYTIIGNICNLELLSLNTNPKIAKLIMEQLFYNKISSNSNPGLTKFIIRNKDKLYPKRLAAPLNTNPLLAELIISFGYTPELCLIFN